MAHQLESSGEAVTNTTSTPDQGISLLSLQGQQVTGDKNHIHGALHSVDSWTYLVNLTAEMLPDNGAGSGHLYNQLMDLKDLTKNSQSEVIVQKFDPDNGLVQRYQIADGQIKQFQPVKSAGPLEDLQNLLADAPRGGHLELINEAHGNGDIGFMGDAGNYSVGNFAQAVKKGLAATGRTSLDVLVLDSCLMGNLQALGALSGLTENVVASELEEFSSTSFGASEPPTLYDMQPINSYLSTMLQQSPQSGNDAASEVLSVGAKSCDSLAPGEKGCGTPTLEIYNLPAASAAEKALDAFGTQLKIAVRSPSNKAAVDSLIGKLPDVSEGVDHLRDVDGFAEGVVGLIDHRALKGTAGSLKSAALDVLEADRELGRAAYVNPQTKIVNLYGKSNLHGLNVFLPGPAFDVRGEAESIVGSGNSQTLPLNVLLRKEIRTSLPDDYTGGWSQFVKAMRT